MAYLCLHIKRIGYSTLCTSGNILSYQYVFAVLIHTLVISFIQIKILHIALARSYFSTFPIQLERLRALWDVKRRKDELKPEDYEMGKHKLNVNHEEFIRKCEQIIRPYRRISSKLSEWILAYFLNRHL